MEATPTELRNHAGRINAVLQDTCDAPDPAPLVHLNDGIIALATSCPRALCREVTTDLGLRELALRLPIPDSRNPRFWIAMQEQWKWKSKHKVCFVECGLRFYVGERSEEAMQFLRLEWVAPISDDDGIQIYQGKHAGHPHWHIDRAALVGQEEHLRSLEALTAPAPQGETEEFSEATTSATAAAQPILDFSWLRNIHLPARAEWMQLEWDGNQVPGPHQCEPNSLDELTHWWAGALRYLSTELPR
jgi:hypothetical protein